MKHVAPYILMLEDDNDDRHITQAFFTERGYDIDLEFFTNSDDVLPYLEVCIAKSLLLPHLIILDRNAPASGGMSVLKQLKSHKVLHTIPVIMISGTVFLHDVNEAYRLGVNSFIAKPFSHEETEKTLDAFVNYWFNVVTLPVQAQNIAAESPVVNSTVGQ